MRTEELSHSIRFPYGMVCGVWACECISIYFHFTTNVTVIPNLDYFTANVMVIPNLDYFTANVMVIPNLDYFKPIFKFINYHFANNWEST